MRNASDCRMAIGVWCVLIAGAAPGCSSRRSEHPATTEVRAALTVNGCTAIDGRQWCANDVSAAPPAAAPFGYDSATRTFSVAVTGQTDGVGPDQRGDENQNLPDQMRFVSTQINGDAEIVVRMVALHAEADAQVGVTIRAGLGGGDDMGAVYVDTLECGGCNPPEHELRIASRAGTRASTVDSRSATEAIPRTTPPTGDIPGEVWFRLQRVGKDFSVDRAGPSKIWVPAFQFSGGEFAPPAAVIGFFVSAGQGVANPTATATFDNIYVGPPRGHKTTWVGGNYNQASTDFVNTSINSFYVDRDGRAYKTNAGAELRYGIDVFNDGKPIRLRNHGFSEQVQGQQGVEQAGVGGDPDDPLHVYMGRREPGPGGLIYCIERRVWNAAQDSLDYDSPTAACPVALGPMAGFAVRNGEIYVSDLGNLADPADDRVRVLSASTLTELTGRGFSLPNAGAIAVDKQGQIWVVQSAIDYPRTAGGFDIKRTASIKCYTRQNVECRNANGTVRQIADASIKNPVALAVDPRSTADRLLIADNGGGPNNDGAAGQNIRIYTSLATTPAPVAGAQGSLGVAGGILSGARGQVFDAASGGYARFYDLIGVGVDSQGNSYVASGNERPDIRSSTPRGRSAGRSTPTRTSSTSTAARTATTCSPRATTSSSIRRARCRGRARIWRASRGSPGTRSNTASRTAAARRASRACRWSDASTASPGAAFYTCSEARTTRAITCAAAAACSA